MGEVKQILDNRDRVVQWDGPADDKFCPLIQEKNRNKQTNYYCNPSAQESVLDRKTSEQRAQTAGWEVSLPTLRL